MSILIPDMEMPKNCLDCHFTDDHSAICKLLNISVYFNVDKRAADCPLVPVPEHGPLVDALDIINTFPEGFIFTNEQAGALLNYIIPADPVKEVGEG